MKFIRNHCANAITVSRIILLPLLVYYVYAHMKTEFFVLMFILAASDFIDGTVAHLLHTESDFGRKLDSIADFCFYPIMSIGSVILLNVVSVIPISIVCIPFISPVIGQLTSLCINGKLPLWHLWSWRATTWITNIFIICSVLWGVQVWLYLILIAVGWYALIEEIAILIRDKGKYNLDIHSYFEKPRPH